MKKDLFETKKNVLGFCINKKMQVFIFTALFFLELTHLSAQTASGTWALTTNANGVAVGNITATPAAIGSGISNPTYSSTSGLSTSGWVTNSAGLVATEYYEYEITPTAGNRLTINSITLNHSVSSGTMTAALYYSYDGFVTNGIQIGGTVTSSTTLTAWNSSSLSLVIPTSGSFSIRVYAWNSNATNKSFRNRNVVITGTTCVPPVITTQPLAQTLCSGTTLSLSTNATAATSYQWKLNGTAISGATSSTYTKVNAVSTDAGTYMVDAINSCLTVTSSAVVVAINPVSVGGTVSSNQTICSGTAPATLTLTGNTGNVINWQKATDAIFSSPIAIAGTTTTLTGASIGNLTTTTYFRAVVQSGLCTPVNSTFLTITVIPVSIGGTVSSDQTICSGTAPATLTLSGNTGTVLKWQKASDTAFTSATDITNTTTSLTGAAIGNLTATTYFRAVVQSGTCASANSTYVTITVNPISIGGTVSSNQTICSGTAPATLTLSGNIGAVINWQKANNAAFTTPTTIAGTATTLTGTTIGNLSATTYFRAVVQSGTCATVNSAYAVITVNAIAIATAGPDQNICGLTTTSLSANAPSSGTGSWSIVSGTGGTVASPSSPTSLFTGTPGATYTLRWTILNSPCATVTDDLILIFNPLPTAVIATATAASICSGSSSVLNGSATISDTTLSLLNGDTFNGTPSYSSAGNSSGGGTVFSQQSSGYFAGFTTITNNIDSSKFMIAVASSFGPATTNSTLTSPLINTVGYSSLSFTYNHSYQKIGSSTAVVQVSTDGGVNWITVKSHPASVGSNTSFVADTINLDAYINQTNFKIRFSTSMSAFFNTAWWAIDGPVLNGNTLVSPLYSWTANTAAGVNGLPVTAGIPSVGNAAISVNPTATTNYTLTATNPNSNCTQTASVQLVVSSAPSISQQPVQPAATCSGSGIQTISVTATGTGLSYSWRKGGVALTNGGVFSGQGTATLTLTSPTVANSGSYDVVVSGTCAPSLTATAVTVLVSLQAVGGSISGSSSGCYSNNSGTLSLSGYSGSIVRWESSTDNFATLGTPITNTSASLAYSGLTNTTYYRALISNGICPSVYATVATISISKSTIWTGTNGTSWNNTANWSCGFIPTNAIDVRIPVTSNQPVVSSDIAMRTLTIDAGVALTVPATYDLTVMDGIANSGTLTVENNANLIQNNAIGNTGTGVTNIKRNSAALMRLDYAMWSSPVDGQQLLSFSPTTLSTRFYTYNPSTNFFTVVAAPAATNFATGTGYLIRMPNTHPATATIWNGTFTGNPHNGNFSIPILANTYNAIGNPYPSTLNADQFILGNTLSDALYFWRKTNNSNNPSYATYTLAGGVGTGNSGDPLGLVPNGIIQVGQGFIVKSNSTTVTFNNAMRTGNNGNQILRNSAIERNRIWLNLTNTDGLFCQMLVGYITGATLGVDSGIDGHAFNSNPTTFCSLINNEEYTIQGRPLPFDMNDAVTLGFKTDTAGNYSIAIDHIDGLFSLGQAIFLKDNLTNTVHDLGVSPYVFATGAGVFNSRFELVYQNTLALNQAIFNANAVVVYKQNQNLVITTGPFLMAEVTVFDVRGRVLVNKKGINAFETTVQTGTTKELLLVQIRSKDGEIITKKVIN